MNGKSKRKLLPSSNRTGGPVKVVLEVLKEKETLAVISKRHQFHPNQIGDWKKQFLEGATTLRPLNWPTLLDNEVVS